MAAQSPADNTETVATRRSQVASLVVCSLEPWREVRRRMRILVDEIVDLEPSVEVLYVAPAVDIPHRLMRRHLAGIAGSRLQQVHPRIHVLQPRKWLPRVMGGFADRSLERQVLDAVGELGLQDPLLWINDADYASFAVRTGWPVLYDITDDWLLADLAPRQLTRLAANEELLLRQAQAVVVCSPDLVRTRGKNRSVELIPNGVDVEMFRAPLPRPRDLPPSPVAVYVGSLHTGRVDVPLVLELAAARPDVQVVLVGPSSLPPDITDQLDRVPNIHLLGSRPYGQVPAYMQHADVVIIPHMVNPFTESLDPIKAYECLAVGRPTVATPVAGFRELGDPVVIAPRERFVAATSAALASATSPGSAPLSHDAPVPTWQSRAEQMMAVMDQARLAVADR